MSEESIRLFVIASTLFLAFMLVIMLIILQIVILDHYHTPIEWHCDYRTGVSFWTWEKRYIRDLTANEKLRFCPRPTRTATPVLR